MSRINLRIFIKTCIPFFFIIGSIIYCELLCRYVSDTPSISFYSILFIISEALFVESFFCYGNDKIYKVFLSIILFALCTFYCVQIIYYKQFGSFASLSLAGMGVDATVNFWWALSDTLKSNYLYILLSYLPLLLLGGIFALSNISFSKIKMMQRSVLFVNACLSWVIAVLILNLSGTGSNSAYESYHSSLVSTDVSASNLGVLTTSIVEAGYLSGILDDSDSLPEFESNIISSLSVSEKAENNSPSNEADKIELKEVDHSPNIFSQIDFNKLAENADIYRAKLCSYFENNPGTEKNEYTGLFEGYNLIYICAESFSSAAIDEQLTPTLYGLANNGIVLTNYYNSFKNVTTNGEYAFMTGLWPELYRANGGGDYSGTFFQTSTKYMPYGLGNIFNGLGVESFGYHGYLGAYYGRNTTHTNLGYTMKFTDTGLIFSTRWPTSDLKLIEQTIDDYINLDRFNVYYMTFSGHGNYNEYNEVGSKNFEEVKDIIGDDHSYSDTALYYLAGNYELEKSLTYLIDRLDKAGKLENTVIVLTGDHFPYCLNSVEYRELTDDSLDSAFGFYKSTCIMWCGAIKDPIINDSLCCNVDILPTILNLFGIEYDSRMLSGADVFSENEHIAVLFNKSFITDVVRFNSQTGQADWLVDVSDRTPKELQEYLESTSAYINSKFTVAAQIINLDFYDYVWRNSGLINDKK